MESEDVLTPKETLIKCDEVDQKIHQKEVQSKIDNEYKSCCLTIDKRALSFFSTLFISLIVITFCIIKLSLNESCESQNTYISLLTFVVGIWVKSPSLK